MSYSVTATFSGEQRKIDGTHPIEMFVVNASQSGVSYQYYANYNQDVYGYQLNASGNVTATEQVYTGLPLKRDGIKTSIDGNTPQVKISIPNTDRAIESLIQNNDYLRGRDIYIISTFAKFLPSGSTYQYIGSTPDSNAVIREKMYIDSTTSNEEIVDFTCKPKFVIHNMTLPRRRYSRECPWNFSATSECEASAFQVASWSTCDYSLEACRDRHNATNFGGFVSIPENAILVG